MISHGSLHHTVREIESSNSLGVGDLFWADVNHVPSLNQAQTHPGARTHSPTAPGSPAQVSAVPEVYESRNLPVLGVAAE